MHSSVWTYLKRAMTVALVLGPMLALVSVDVEARARWRWRWRWRAVGADVMSHTVAAVALVAADVC